LFLIAKFDLPQIDGRVKKAIKQVQETELVVF